MSDETRHIPSIFDSGFVPSQIDPRTNIDRSDDSHVTPVFAEQNFFPSFFHSGVKLPAARPFRHIGSTSGRFISSTTTHSPYDESILGSGDFSVLRGGTFYPDDDETRRRPSHDYFGSGSSFHDSNDGSRPFALPLEAPQHFSDDPFADFKDFADITAGIDGDFSHFVVVYANKNSSTVKHEPKNILEQLQMIDEENLHEAEKRVETTAQKSPKVTKLSKFKSKLLSTKVTKETKKVEVKKKTTIDYVDPLLAES